MRPISITVAAVLLTLGRRASAREAGTQAAPLQEVHRIALDRVEGRIDHLAYDAANNRLYVAALGNNTVEVLDLKAGKRAGQIQGVGKPQGVCVLPGSGTLAVASGDDGECRFFSPQEKLLGAVDGLDDADNVRYDAEAGLLYVGYGAGASGALAMIDPKRMQKVADIKLDGHPESFRLEEKGNRIFVNVPSSKHEVRAFKPTRSSGS